MRHLDVLRAAQQVTDPAAYWGRCQTVHVGAPAAVPRITKTQLRLLQILASQPAGMTVAELCAAASSERTAVLRRLALMVRDGRVVRVRSALRSPAGRSVDVYLATHQS